jgi:hypothetical protein
MSGIISGLLGALIAGFLTQYIAAKVGKGGEPGQLRFGAAMWVLGLGCSAFALFPIASTLFWGQDKDLWAKIGLFVCFGLGAVYSFGEAAFARGGFDEQGIWFSTPWTGLKRERWENLETIELNDWASWYTFTFSTGTKIRLSRYLIGHISAIEMAEVQCELK